MKAQKQGLSLPRYAQCKKTLKYTNEFQLSGVDMSLIEGVKVGKVSAWLDIHPYMLSIWRKEYRERLIVADKRKKITTKGLFNKSYAYIEEQY